MAAFTSYSGWVEWRNRDNEWGHYWCVTEPEGLSLYPDESCDVTRQAGNWMVISTSRAMSTKTPGLPPVALQVLEGRPHGFIVVLEGVGEEGRQMLYLDAPSAEECETWQDAIAAAAATPKQLEAWIDDFSDVEDDGHARRSSIEHTEGIDWSKLTPAQRKSIRGLSDDGLAPIGKALSVKAANLADYEDDMEARMSGGMGPVDTAYGDLDWATLTSPKKQAADAAAAAAEAEEAEDGAEDEEGEDAEEEAAEDEEEAEVTEETSVATKGSQRKDSEHKEIFGECF